MFRAGLYYVVVIGSNLGGDVRGGEKEKLRKLVEVENEEHRSRTSVPE
jgi:hypothetical protein